ncbi:hypothetical protein AAG570_001137 [Ranatra chinensis]|uniref:Laminin G domain-containing protein n=1 Tax=Ranatra chinensis TaxID=642074 RepID=A0ABD0YB03_9HEMI
MMTTGRYNAGNWTRVEASRYFDRKKKLEKGVLKVGDEIRDGAPTHPAGRDTIPDMSETRYFIGGLPPGVPPLQRNLHPFLGCMSELQIAQEGYNPLKGQFWGVQPSCSNNPLTVAGFYGNGYLELPSQTLKKKANFGFVFSTRRHDALLMLSTFEGLGSYLEDKEEVTNLVEQEERKLSYYSVSLRRGQVDVRLNGGRGEVRLASVGPDLADAAAHSVSVSKLGRRLELRVDDHLEATALLPAEGGAPVRAPGPQGGLYFGGLPPHFNTTGRTFSAVPFVGTIKDAIFNDMILGFNDAVAFKEVTIGRYGPDGHEGGENGSGDGEGCRKVASYNLEPGAVKLGDTPGSHVRINLRKRSLLHKNFTLQLQFRTFHPNGLLFITVGGKGKQPHYLMVGLRNGRVHVALKAKRKADISAHVVVNDGIWHKMVLEKQGRHLVLRVDSTDPEKVKTAKRTNVGSLLYVGGLPTSGVNLPEALLNRLEGFKGCIRGLVLNNKEEDLVGDKAVAVGVGQCFPHIEPGSYFPGDAYAIYKNKFNIGSFLELELELRTSELNGVLLSVSEPDGYPALSLELEGGSVLLSGDMGDRRPFQVRQPFPTKAAACDNKWHRVQAAFFDDRLTLRVDGGTGHSYWLADNGHLTQATTNSPLYIGGIPEGSTSGTLQSRENFKGCLRNVIINGERRDWTDMAALQNILLSSCPLVSN